MLNGVIEEGGPSWRSLLTVLREVSLVKPVGITDEAYFRRGARLAVGLVSATTVGGVLASPASAARRRRPGRKPVFKGRGPKIPLSAKQQDADRINKIWHISAKDGHAIEISGSKDNYGCYNNRWDTCGYCVDETVYCAGYEQVSGGPFRCANYVIRDYQCKQVSMDGGNPGDIFYDKCDSNTYCSREIQWDYSRRCSGPSGCVSPSQ